MVFYFKRLYILSVFLILNLVISCGLNVEDPFPPSRPRWVEKSAPEDTIEKGIDAYHENNSIFLQWYLNDEDDIAFYEIYRKKVEPDSEGNFVRIVTIEIISLINPDTFYYDQGIKINKNYFYYLRAIDRAGNKSIPSDTIRYRIIPKPIVAKPLGQITDTIPLFQWNDFSNLSYEYVIRIEEAETGNLIWISRFLRPNYGDFEQSKLYNFDGKAIASCLERNKLYRWRVDAIAEEARGVEIAGSESEWGYFKIK
ncbi:MAG: hypothetical protein H0Z29_06675 [Candidatus Marinimicrobia bacterium]|nr:hypothetical protein [Candidatus Neomarinimicrobiota bacterium]